MTNLLELFTLVSVFSLYSEGKAGNLSATLELKLNRGELVDPTGSSEVAIGKGVATDRDARVAFSDARIGVFTDLGASAGAGLLSLSRASAASIFSEDSVGTIPLL